MEPFRIPAEVGQFPHDSGGCALVEFSFRLVHNGGGGRSDASDVLQKEEERTAIGRDADDFEEKPAALAVKPGAPTRNGQVLTGESGNDAIHLAAPCASVEGADIGPDRSRIHRAFFHARDHDCGGVSFPLNVANGAIRDAQVGEPGSQSLVEHSDAREEGDSSEGT
jgi:hypothetical protein